MASTQSTSVSLPRVAITYCTQCRWMLRAAYFGQELLSTFGNQIGEIALIPATGGLFKVELAYKPQENDTEVRQVLLWDRKAEGGFPETKVLKQRVRDYIDPAKDLGHSDRHGKKKDVTQDAPTETKTAEATAETMESKLLKTNAAGTVCEDCT
ncbi:seleno protein domain-containing protein [Westerdykella ornata]|uniref:Seleno protein domain-containing protein n=1 Tax=Westerdykella ornata TaxID=318751 RepID=A0A6A6JBT8_WESOR|nr:seleno protein domain-containing protein [Westerdykella ornata]KAF2273727.1 seleno protein domain-containing protein [Westerdykella ornata]